MATALVQSPLVREMEYMRRLTQMRNVDALRTYAPPQEKNGEEDDENNEEKIAQEMEAEDAAQTFQNTLTKREFKKQELDGRIKKLLQELSTAVSISGLGLLFTGMGSLLNLIPVIGSVIGFLPMAFGSLLQFIARNKMTGIIKKEQKIVAESKKHNVQIKPLRYQFLTPSILVALITGAFIATIISGLLFAIVAYVPIAVISNLPGIKQILELIS